MIRNTSETQTIADISVAMILGRPVTIDYENADGVRSVRVVEPFEIVNREDAVKRPFFRAMDRLSHDYRTFRFDRLYAYRVSNARGRYKVARPVREHSMEFSVFTETVPPQSDPMIDWDAEWADFNELQYDPDAPVPFLPTDYPEA